MSINFIIVIGIVIFAIGIIIGIACGKQSSESFFIRINSALEYKFNSFESSWKWQMENMEKTLSSLSKTIYNLDSSNVEKNKNIQLDRVVKIITEELNKFK